MTNVELVPQIVAEARKAAHDATNDYIARNGQWDACGFSWIRVYEKGSTKLGRALLKNGFRKAYGGGLEMWNPSGNPTQSITAKEEGSMAAAKVFEQYGIKAYAGSRMD